MYKTERSLYTLTDIIKLPESTNASLQEGNVTFSCSIEGEALLWYIDEYLADSPAIKGRDITYRYIESGLHVLSNLSIPAEVDNNNTQVRCVGLGNGTAVNSSIVLLQLQGKL